MISFFYVVVVVVMISLRICYKSDTYLYRLVDNYLFKEHIRIITQFVCLIMGW